MKKIASFNIIVLIGIGFINSVFGQNVSVSNDDSLSLDNIILKVIENHPSLKIAEESSNEADAKVGLAKTSYLPEIDASVSYSRIGPVPTIDFPPIGEFKLYPENNYNASVNLRQTLYDFGKTSNTVKLASEIKVVSTQNITVLKQKLALVSTNLYFSIIYIDEAIKIKQMQIDVLKSHYEMVKKKKETGSATDYELLSTNVRISSIENQKIDLQSKRTSLLASLNSLLGQSPEHNLKLRSYPMDINLSSFKDSLIDIAMQNRTELKIAKEKETIANLQVLNVKSQNNPVLSAFATGGGKNGYVPELNKIKANYVLGIGLRIPLFDAQRKKFSLIQANSQMNSTLFETELVRRNISDEVIENQSIFKSAALKIEQAELQLEQAEQAFKLAKISYSSGSLTNIDLLDAEKTVSESQLLLLGARIDYYISLFKLKAAIGEKLYPN